MTKTNVQYYLDYLDLMLGGDYVEIEIKDVLSKVIMQSLEEFKEYKEFTKLVTVPYSHKIDLKKYKVSDVVFAYRTNSIDSISNEGASTDAFALALGMVGGGGHGGMYDLTKYGKLLQYRKLRNTITSDLDWRWEAPYLYCTQSPISGAQITIEYVPNIERIEQVDDDFWIGKLKKLCLANAKIVLARVRGKYSAPTGAVYQNDAATLLAEGTAEKKEIKEFLETNYNHLVIVGS